MYIALWSNGGRERNIFSIDIQFYIFAIMTKENIQDLRDRTTSLRRHL